MVLRGIIGAGGAIRQARFVRQTSFHQTHQTRPLTVTFAFGGGAAEEEAALCLGLSWDGAGNGECTRTGMETGTPEGLPILNIGDALG